MRLPHAKAAEEAAAPVKSSMVGGLRKERAWQQQTPGGGGSTEWAVGDNRVGGTCGGGKDESPANYPIGIREGQHGPAGRSPAAVIEVGEGRVRSEEEDDSRKKKTV